MKRVLRMRWLLLAIVALMSVGAACQQSDYGDDDGDKKKDGGSEILRAQDAKTLTLQLGDVPQGSSEGEVVEITPGNLDQLHADGKIDDDLHQLLGDTDFKSVARKSFTVDGDGALFSVAAVFESVEDAKKYFSSGTRGTLFEDAPSFGDESFAEKISSGPPASGETVINQETIHTRVRIANVVIDISESRDPDEGDEDEVFDLTEIAVSKVK